MPVSLELMHWVDRYLGSALCTVLQPLNLRHYLRPPPSPDALDPRHVLLIKFWGLGSIALAGPAVAALRRRFPQARFTFLSLAPNRELLELLPEVDGVLTVDLDRGLTGVTAQLLARIGTLRREGCDLVVDFEFFTRVSALVTFLTGAPVRAGFHAWEVWRGNFHNVRVPFNRYWHVQRNFLQLAAAVGAEVEPPPLFRLPVTAAMRAEAAAALAAVGVGAEEELLLVNPNAGAMALERRWPADRFAALARRAAATTGLRPVFLGARGEEAYVAGIVAAAGPPAVSLAGRLSLRGLLGLFCRARLLVTNDSGPLQLALTQGLRTVSFFGPETPVLYGPRGERHRVLYAGIPCSPCMNVHSQKRVRCLYGHPVCLEQLDVDRALAAVRDLAAAPPARTHG